MMDELVQYFFTGFGAGVLSALIGIWIFTSCNKKEKTVSQEEKERVLEIVRKAKEKNALTEEEINSIVENTSKPINFHG